MEKDTNITEWILKNLWVVLIVMIVIGCFIGANALFIASVLLAIGNFFGFPAWIMFIFLGMLWFAVLEFVFKFLRVAIPFLIVIIMALVSKFTSCVKADKIDDDNSENGSKESKFN